MQQQTTVIIEGFRLLNKVVVGLVDEAHENPGKIGCLFLHVPAAKSVG